MRDFRVRLTVLISIFVIAAVGYFSEVLFRLEPPRAQDQDVPIEIVAQISHTGGIGSVAVSQDGRWMVSGSEDKTAKIWDTRSGLLLRSLNAPGPTKAVAISADGEWVVTGGRVDLDGPPSLDDNWEDTKEEPRDIDATEKDDSDQTESDSSRGNGADSDSEAKKNRGELMLWNARTGQLRRAFRGEEFGDYDIESVAFDPDGKTIVATGRSNIRVWDIDTGSIIRTIEAAHWDKLSLATIGATAISPDGKSIAIGLYSAGGAFSASKENTQGVFEVQDIATGNTLWSVEAPITRSAAFSHDGKVVLLGTEEGSIVVWDAKSGRSLRTFEKIDTPIVALAISPDNQRVLSLSAKGDALVSDVDSGERARTFSTATDFMGAVRNGAVTFSPDGNSVVIAGESGDLKVWDVSSGALLRSYDKATEYIGAIDIAGEKVIASSDWSIAMWNSGVGRLEHVFKSEEQIWGAVRSSPGGKSLFVGTTDGGYLVDLASGKRLRNIGKGYDLFVKSAVFSPDGRRLAIGARAQGKLQAVTFWDVESGKLLRQFRLSDGEEFPGPVSVDISSDGNRIAATSLISDEKARVWNIRNGKLLFELPPGGRICFSPNGQHVLVAGMENWKIGYFDAATGQAVKTFTGHSTVVWETEFSPDGNIFVSGDADGVMKIWDIASGSLVETISGNWGAITGLRFSRDGERLYYSGSDGVLRVWDVPKKRLLAHWSFRGDGEWLSMVPEGFFASSSHGGALMHLTRGFEAIDVRRLHQSLFNPDLVIESLSGDASGEVAAAKEVAGLAQLIDSGPAPEVEIVKPEDRTNTSSEALEVEVRVSDKGKGIGRVEWRVNGITVGVDNPDLGSKRTGTLRRTLHLDPGENTIEVFAYNAGNLLASIPAKANVTWTGIATTEPKLHVLAIGINKYIDKGGVSPGKTGIRHFPPLARAVPDATAVSEELRKAGQGLYGDVQVRTLLDEQAKAANLDAVITEMAKEISPRDTFVLYVAAHGYSHEGRFYLIPQDYEGGPVPAALAAHAIDQLKIQDWIVNRIRAKKALILLDTCESGAL
ncbi:Ig-like domain-containing protein, partial [Hyphomicrobium sp.]|uniref:Ig-like domain-containing protein n=1 Tax=Hyphomicrobium sp. TaxID=82 RepID=UPI0025BA180F